MLRQRGEKLAGGKWFTASAERNKGPILEVLRRVLPRSGLVLEIGSGTGQHVTYFASALPHLTWQPSDRDPEFRDAVASRLAEEELAKINPPLLLDVARHPWPLKTADAVVCINMIHVAPWSATLALFEGASTLLQKDGVLVLYGPYRRFGGHTSPSNEQFDAELRAQDPEWGLRDVETVAEVADSAGFTLTEVIDMPASNFSVIFTKRQS